MYIIISERDFSASVIWDGIVEEAKRQKMIPEDWNGDQLDLKIDHINVD